MKTLLIFAILAAPLGAQTVNPNQIRPSTTNGQALMTVTGNTEWSTLPSLSIQYNGSSTGILQNPLNFTDNGTISLDSGYQQVKAKTNTGGAWTFEILSTTAASLLQVYSQPPVNGQYTIVYPTSVTALQTCTTGNAVSTNNSGGLGIYGGPLGNCVWQLQWAFSPPANIPSANITAVYPFVIGSSGGSNPGSVQYSSSVSGTGTLISGINGAPILQQFNGPAQSSPTSVLSSLTITGTVATDNGYLAPIKSSILNLPLIGAYVYYTGTPVTSPTALNIVPPLNYNAATNALSINLPDNAALDFGIANAYQVFLPWQQVTYGSTFSMTTANANTTTTPTVQVSTYPGSLSALTIVGPFGGPLCAGDIGDSLTSTQSAILQYGISPAAGGTPVFYLENPQNCALGSNAVPTVNTLTASTQASSPAFTGTALSTPSAAPGSYAANGSFGGSLPLATYYGKIALLDANGFTTLLSPESAAATLTTAGGYVQWTWPQALGPTVQLWVGTGSGAENTVATVTGTLSGNIYRYNQMAAFSSGTPQTANTTGSLVLAGVSRAQGYQIGTATVIPSAATGYTGTAASNVVLSASPILSGTTTIPTLKLNGTNTMTHVPRAYPAWHIPAGGTITTGTPVGPVFWSGEGSVIERFTANLAGSNSCTVAPVIAIISCTTAACTSTTMLTSLTTGTTNGIFDSGTLSITIPASVFFTAEFTAGTCTGKPSFDAGATVRQN